MASHCDTLEKIKAPKQLPSLPVSIYAAKYIRFAAIVTAVYFLLSYVLIGFKGDQIVLALIFNTLYFATATTRRFILAFSIFIVYWIVFDYMKAFPNYRYNDVHIESLYQWEKSWFGFEWKNNIVTPNEYFAQHTSAFIDIMAGIFYLCWIPVPLAFAGVMFFKNRKLFFQFSLTFVLVNLIGFIGYYIYPAAPPWYVAQNGFQFLSSTPGNTAGLGRFDALVGLGIFKSIYSKSSNVFAAMPSLHAAYMLIVLYYGRKAKLGAWNILFAFILIGIWFAAIYSSHHYVLDVLAGISCAILGIFLFQYWARSSTGQNVLSSLIRITSK